MKKHVWLVLILIAVLGSAAVSTKAQANRAVRADVPFDFIVGDKTLSSGTVTVSGISSANFGLLAISNSEKSQSAIRLSNPTGSIWRGQAKLVFHKYGNRYYLAQLWMTGYEGLELNRSKSERAIERETMLSKNSSSLELVTVVADMR